MEFHFGEYVNQSETDKSELPALFTLSPYRLEQIRKASSVPVCIVGPYIAYSKDYLDNKSIEHSGSAWKTILAIPSHSVRGGTVSYDYKDFINEIRRVKNAINAQTILVMLYYQDILNGDAAIFEDAGFVVVTCGYREDCHFLERQRTLIKLADFTMSNSIGTHVGTASIWESPIIPSSNGMNTTSFYIAKKIRQKRKVSFSSKRW